jgi:hypothetical protein
VPLEKTAQGMKGLDLSAADLQAIGRDNALAFCQPCLATRTAVGNPAIEGSWTKKL